MTPLAGRLAGVLAGHRMSQDFLIDAVSATNPTLVAAPGPRQFIRVLSYHLTTNSVSQTTVVWRSGTTEKSRDRALVDANDVSVSDEDSGVFDCAPGESLNVQISGGPGSRIGGCGKYTILGGV